jgi:hypothetical protein
MLNIASSGLSRAAKRERTFKISVPAIVKGRNALDQEFVEKTTTASLSAQEAALWLRSKVLIGSKLLIWLNIPETFFLETPLKLMISGTISYIKSDVTVKRKDQLISLLLDKDFRIQSLP